MPKRKIALLSLTATVLIWGIATPVIKITLEYTTPFTFLFFRMLVASIIVFPLFIREMSIKTFEKRDALKLVIFSIFGQTINLSFVFFGLDRTTAIEGAIIASITPVITIIAGAILLNEIIMRLEKLGLIIIMVGALITFYPSIISYQQGIDRSMIGNILLIVSGISWTAFVIMSKDLFEKYSPRHITAFTFFIGLATFTPLMLWEQSQPEMAAQLDLIKATPGILYMAIFGSIIAYHLYEIGLEYIEASEVSVFHYLIPLFAIIPSYLLLGETLTRPMILGGIIIAMGVLISNKGSSNQRLHLRKSKI